MCHQTLQIYLRDRSKRYLHDCKRYGTLWAKVIVVEDRDPAGGYLGTRLRQIDQILRSDPHAVWLNQYANIANKMFTPSKRQMRSRASLKESIGSLSGPALLYPRRGLRTTSSSSQGLKLWPSSRRAL
jgi:hypothetical protein